MMSKLPYPAGFAVTADAACICTPGPDPASSPSPLFLFILLRGFPGNAEVGAKPRLTQARSQNYTPFSSGGLQYYYTVILLPFLGGSAFTRGGGGY